MFAQIRQHKFMCIHASQVITSFRSTPRHNATTPRLKSLRKPLGPKKVEGKPQSLSSHMSHLISCLDFFGRNIRRMDLAQNRKLLQTMIGASLMWAWPPSLIIDWLSWMVKSAVRIAPPQPKKKRTVGQTEILGTNMNITIFLDILLGSFRNPFEGQHHLKRIDKFILSQKSDSKQLCALSSLSWPQLHQFCSSAGLWPGEMQGILVVLMATWDTWARNICCKNIYIHCNFIHERLWKP